MSTTETPEASATDVRPEVKKPRGPRKKRTGLTVEQQALTAKYLPLARTVARPFKLSWPRCRDELDSAACLALVEAAQTFNPALGVKFTTFARRRIMGALYDMQRYLYNKAHPRQLPNARQTFYYVPGTDEIGMLMLTSKEPEVGSELASAEEVEHWFESLPPRHARVCREIYVHGRSQVEAAEAVGRVKSRVCNLHAEALTRLRRSAAVRDAATAIGLDVSRN